MLKAVRMSEALEAEIRGHWDRGEFDLAATAAIKGYGDEVFSFLIARLRAEDRAWDVFGQTCEDLWRSTPTFEWRCSMRTWIYRLARSASMRFERSPANRAGRRVALSRVSEIAQKVRSRTMMHLRTEIKDEFQKLREQLDPDEQTLLVLRIDRGLGWTEISEIMSEPSELEDSKARERASARLRQRFQKLKQRLRELAEARGLLGEG
jgi:RNA polymerase sigma-70 factor, ECF subfamily